MRLLLINPCNQLSSMVKVAENRWNKYRVWKPLGLLVVAGLTPPEWEVSVIDENLGTPDYERLPRPDLVALTAFTSQAPRAYDVASEFRSRGVPVVMGGIHATMCPDEAADHVDAIVTGEAESVWAQVLRDVRDRALKRRYDGVHLDMDRVPLARHDLLPKGYHFGAIQTTRGCPLNCSFCSVSTFNGRAYRHRPIDDVVEEFKQIREKHILVVDDNLIGTRGDHVARAKDLFRAMIDAGLRKRWVAQATINMADDEELLKLAARAGCAGVFIGFEATTDDGLIEIHKKYNMRKGRNYESSVRRIQRHGIVVVGSFIMGLDVDGPGVGIQISRTAKQYGVDAINVLFLTPLPGTDLWKKMEAAGRIESDNFPQDWRYYSLTIPVARYNQLTRDEIVDEMNACNRDFYARTAIFRRVIRNCRIGHKPFLTLVCNLSFRNNARLGRTVHEALKRSGDRLRTGLRLPATGENLHVAAPSHGALAVDTIREQ